MTSEATVMSKTVFARHSVDAPAQSVHNLAQLPVVHVDGAPPRDAPGIDGKGVALIDVVVRAWRSKRLFAAPMA